MSTEKFQCLHPDPDKSGVNIDRRLYDALRVAILAVVPVEGAGDPIPWSGLTRAVAPHLPTGLFEGRSLGWYTISVKLDLEARGEVVRAPGRGPQRLLRPARA